MGQANMDVRVFKETKLTDGIYTQGSAGYRVVATSETSRHCDGVVLFCWESPDFAVEAIRQLGVNVIAYQLLMGYIRWYIVRCYLA